MSLELVGGRHDRFNDAFNALSSRRARQVVGLLRDRSAPATAEDLAATLATSDRERSRVLIDLEHSVLPKLDDAGLIDRTDAGVGLADHPALDDATVERLLDDDSEDADELCRVLSDPRRRRVLSVLDGRAASMDRRTLATAVAARERDPSDTALPDQNISDVLVSLHHVHLPMLEDAGLVELDADGELVRYTGHPVLDEDGDAESDAAPVGLLH